jgi:hypothetical protein
MAATNFTGSFIGDVSCQGMRQLPRIRLRVTHVPGLVCHLCSRSEPPFCVDRFFDGLRETRGAGRKSGSRAREDELHCAIAEAVDSKVIGGADRSAMRHWEARKIRV